MEDYEQIWLRLKAAKKASGVTNQQIIERTGIPEGTVNKILAGQTKNANVQYFAAICEAIGADIDEMIYGKEGTKKAPTEYGEREQLRDIIGSLPDETIHALLVLAEQFVQQQ